MPKCWCCLRHLWGTPCCELCISNARSGGEHWGHYGYRIRHKQGDQYMPKYLKKQLARGGDTGVSPVTAGCHLALKWPALCEFLTAVEWEPGEVRQPGTLLICWGDGRWRGWLNDRDMAQTAWMSADSLSELLEAVEAAFQAGAIEWRKAPGKPQQRKGR